MNLKQIEKLYSLSLIHNPRHFMGNSFQVEEMDGRLILTGRIRKNGKMGYKNLSRVAILHPKRRYD